MIDHIYLPVTNVERSEAFYTALLSPLGKSDRFEFKAQAGWPDLWGFGSPRPGFWLKQAERAVLPELYVAFAALNEQSVNQAYEAALRNGGKDNGGVGLRPQFHVRYYAANVLDPDGYGIEVCYKPWLYE